MEDTISLIIKEVKNRIPLSSRWLQDTVIVDVVDLGILSMKFGNKHKLSLVFELEEYDTEESTLSLLNGTYGHWMTQLKNKRLPFLL